ncbi:MAG: hypothetical protein Q7R92_00680 [bacterium]|nr:hypothetical protein [bacterium]
MNREELIKKINNFLDQSPFDDREIKTWKEKMLKMNETDLNELYNLLQEKLKILTESNQLLINIAEDIVKEQDKEIAEMPKKINFIDLPIASVAGIIKHDLAKYLKSQKTDMVILLDGYFIEAFGNNENVVDEFDMLIKAVTANNEFLDSKSRRTISQWLKLYNQSNENSRRKNIDRINFVNQSNEAKKLSKETVGYLLNLLRLYDYLLDPESVLTTINKTEEKAVTGAPRKTVSKNLSEQEKQIIDLRKIAAQYPAGSFERKAVEEEIDRITRSA